MCMYTEHLYSYPYARALGRCPVDESQPAHATRSRAHMPAFTHNRTNGNPYPYPFRLQKYPAPLAVVSTQARLLWQCEHMFTLGAVLSPLRTLVRLCVVSAWHCEHTFVLLGVPNFSSSSP
jgi:hypothetical protein